MRRKRRKRRGQESRREAVQLITPVVTERVDQSEALLAEARIELNALMSELKGKNANS